MVQQGAFPFASYPIVLGHEVAGVVEETGKGVDKLKPGDRVGLSALFSTCGSCRQCIAGDENLLASTRRDRHSRLVHLQLCFDEHFRKRIVPGRKLRP